MLSAVCMTCVGIVFFSGRFELWNWFHSFSKIELPLKPHVLNIIQVDEILIIDARGFRDIGDLLFQCQLSIFND